MALPREAQLGLLAVLVAVGCRARADDPAVDAAADAPLPDAGAADDATVIDAAVVDATVIDAAAADAAVDAALDATIDAGVDAAIDATIDAGIDAAVDATIDATPVDAGAIDAMIPDGACGGSMPCAVDATGGSIPGGVDAGTGAPPVDAGESDAMDADAAPGPAPAMLPTIGELEVLAGAGAYGLKPVPGDATGAIYACVYDGIGGAEIGLLMRVAPGPGNPTFSWSGNCGGAAVVDGDRAMAVKAWPMPAPETSLAIGDFSTLTLSIVPLPSPTASLRGVAVQRAPGGYLALGVALHPTTHQATGSILWHLDENVAVTDTVTVPYLGVYGATMLPTAPRRYARMDGTSTVTIHDATTGQLIETIVAPIDHVRGLLPGPDRLIAVGTVGDQAAIVPLGSSVPTIVPGVAPGWRAGVDARGRVVIVDAVGDHRTIHVRRVDDALFDGVDGASRIDPALGPGGVAQAAYGLQCGLGADLCPPLAYRRYELFTVAIAANGFLAVSAQFRDVFQFRLAAVVGWIALPP